MIYLALFVDFLYKFIAPILVFFALWFVRKVSDLQAHGEQLMIPRYKLPEILGWIETKDELMPGDISIPIVANLYRKFGWFICAWYWLGIRNTGSIMWAYGKESPNYLAVMTDEQKQQYGIYQNVKQFGIFKLITGWNVYKDWYNVKTQNGFWAVPYISLRIK